MWLQTGWLLTCSLYQPFYSVPVQLFGKKKKKIWRVWALLGWKKTDMIQLLFFKKKEKKKEKEKSQQAYNRKSVMSNCRTTSKAALVFFQLQKSKVKKKKKCLAGLWAVSEALKINSRPCSQIASTQATYSERKSCRFAAAELRNLWQQSNFVLRQKQRSVFKNTSAQHNVCALWSCCWRLF